MIEGRVLHGFLDRLTEKALKEIEKGGNLNQQNAMPFLIKEQFTKISRIEEDFATSAHLLEFKQYSVERFGDIDRRFQEVDKRFEEVDKRFDRLEKELVGLRWFMGIGFSFLSVLITTFKFF